MQTANIDSARFPMKGLSFYNSAYIVSDGKRSYVFVCFDCTTGDTSNVLINT